MTGDRGQDLFQEATKSRQRMECSRLLELSGPGASKTVARGTRDRITQKFDLSSGDDIFMPAVVSKRPIDPPTPPTAPPINVPTATVRNYSRSSLIQSEEGAFSSFPRSPSEFDPRNLTVRGVDPGQAIIFALNQICTIPALRRTYITSLD